MTVELTETSDAPESSSQASLIAIGSGTEWWRSAVIYQIYPRSFADSDGDGIGDLPGITSRLDSLADLGRRRHLALALLHFSPARRGLRRRRLLDVDPLFGTLADFDTMLARAHELGLKVIVDLVPNHTSWDHEWFKAALAAPEGSPERDRYMFRDGLGENGEIAPNNWQSVFGGPMWERTTNADGTPGQWYLHIFDVSQPDLNWENPWVREQMLGVLRFWLDRGVDGFRVDVAHGLVKEAGLPDYTPPADAGSMGGGVSPLEPGIDSDDPPTPPYWAQDGVHEIYRSWHEVLDEYEGDRVLCAEAWVEPLTKLARWVRPDEMQQAFNFTYLVGIMERSRAAHRDRHVDPRVRHGRRPLHLGALEPRRRSPRQPPRARRRQPAGRRHRPEVPRAPRPGSRTPPGPSRHGTHARPSRQLLRLPG